MDEYIEREAAIAAIMSETPDAHYPSWYADKIKSIPAADVEPVRHGQWIQYRKNLGECSGCGYVVSIRSKYPIAGQRWMVNTMKNKEPSAMDCWHFIAPLIPVNDDFSQYVYVKTFQAFKLLEEEEKKKK